MTIEIIGNAVLVDDGGGISFKVSSQNAPKAYAFLDARGLKVLAEPEIAKITPEIRTVWISVQP